MSSRAARKLLNSKGTTNVTPKEEENNEEDVHEVTSTTRNRNIFQLLDSDTADTREYDDDGEDESTVTQVPAKKVAQSKRKKEAKKKKRPTESKTNTEEEDIDELIKQYSEHMSTTSTSSTKSEDELDAFSKSNLFQLDVKCLNLQNEVVKLFGKNMVKRDTQMSRKGVHLKKTLLVKAKPNWPRIVSGVSMDLVTVKDGINYFKYTWSSSYRKMQEQFYMCVQTNDPGTFQALLHEHPYHVDSLLQLSEVCKQTGELDTALDLIERSIYYLECSWHHLFNPVVGNCRLDFKEDENRTLFLALFRYIQLLGRKGFSRTATEYCKLLLSLDPSDPLCVLFIFDSYCLRSGQNQYLLDFYTSDLMKSSNLTTLPNMVFSVALAKFRLEQVEESKESKSPNADDLLQYALMLFPMMLGPLVKKCKLNLIDNDPSSFSRDLSKHGFFASAQCPQSLSNLITLYIERSGHLWQVPEISPWLCKNVLIVTQKAEQKDPMIENCCAILQEEYVNSPKMYYNHLLLSEFTDSTVNALPADLLDTIRREGGGVRLYDTFQQHQIQSQPVIHASTSNPFLLFLSTLFSPDVPNAPPIPTNAGNNSGWLASLLNLLDTRQEEEEEQHPHDQ